MSHDCHLKFCLQRSVNKAHHHQKPLTRSMVGWPRKELQGKHLPDQSCWSTVESDLQCLLGWYLLGWYCLANQKPKHYQNVQDPNMALSASWGHGLPKPFQGGVQL